MKKKVTMKDIKDVENSIIKKKNTANDFYKKHSHELNILNKRLSDLRDAFRQQMEIHDTESRRCGYAWTSAELDDLETMFRDFVYKAAKKHERSTLAIRYKVLRLMAIEFSSADWNNAQKLIVVGQRL